MPSFTLLVRLPAERAALCAVVTAAGGTPVIDLTAGATVPEVPEGAWIRVRAGQPAPGTGPVVLVGGRKPIVGRACWLETVQAGTTPEGFEGVILRGREAGGAAGTADGLSLLADHHGPAILDAGVGPATTASAAALGARGVVLFEQVLAFVELGLPAALRARLAKAADTSTRVVKGYRLWASPLAPVVRKLAGGADPDSLEAGWFSGDPALVAWPVGQGVTLSGELARRHETLADCLRAFRAAAENWSVRVGDARAWDDVDAPRARTATALRGRNGRSRVAEPSGAVGSAVLWQEAVWEGQPVAGTPLIAAMATGCPVAAPAAELVRARAEAGMPEAAPPAPTPAAAAVAVAVERAEELVAIVGLGCRLPGANSVDEYWDNVLAGRNLIREVPADRWDASLYWDSDRNTPDKTYTRIGGFITDFAFEPRAFRIPPKVARVVDPVQQLALAAVHDALLDAGLGPDASVDRSRIAVILGNSMGGEMKDSYALRVHFPAVRKALGAIEGFAELPAAQQAAILDTLEAKVKADLPPITEDSMPGELSNVIAGRVANAFDLGGPNFTTDAACASSMAALQSAVKGLQDHDYDYAVTGGVDRSMDPATYTKFCKIGALSPDHSAPFDASANGFVMGEGAGILVLKRLSDAEADGDRIYAVIRGIGASSDGKGKGITAPNIVGQKRALRRAYADAGLDPVEVDLVECHGTSTVVGDKVEVEALSEVVGAGRRGDRGPIRIGSVKSQIGHLKSAAGAAATIKMAMALYTRTLPPTINFEKSRPDVPFDQVPLAVQDTRQPWVADGWQRVAGVSAFGFGGTNFHVVLAEHVAAPEVAVRAMPVRAEVVERPLPDGIWAVSAATEQELSERLAAVERGEATPWEPARRFRLAAAADTVEEQRAQVAKVRKSIAKNRGHELLRMRGVHLEDEPCDGQLAYVFTGQGSQYIGMGLDLAAHYPVVAATFAEADRVMSQELGRPLSDYIAGQVHDDADVSFEALRATEISQPATLTVDVAILRLLAAHGVMPDMVAGHSLGEYGAAVASGMMDFASALMAVSARGREMANVKLDDFGKMAGIAAGVDVVQEVLAEVPGYVVAANKNCPTQTVIAGESDAVEAASEAFRGRDITVYPLPVSHAFHSRIVAPASEPLRRVLERLELKAPVRRITTNVTADWYPTGPDAREWALDNLAAQVASPVEWIAQVERMYASGARVFVECGPKRALTGFNVAILKRRPHRALYTNNPKTGGVRSFRDSLAGLLALGFPVKAQPATSVPDLFTIPEARFATSEQLVTRDTPTAADPEVAQALIQMVSVRTGLPADEIDLDWELEADLGVDTVRQAEMVAEARKRFRLAREAGFLLSDHRTTRQLVDYFASRLGRMKAVYDRSQPAVAQQPRGVAELHAEQPLEVNTPVLAGAAVSGFLESAARSGLAGLDPEAFASALLPSVQGLLSASWEAFRSAERPPAIQPTAAPTATVVTTAAAEPVRVVCTGVSMGLPGGEAVFADDNVEAILRGDNRIGKVPAAIQDRLLDKGLVRLVKDEAGQGSFLPVSERDQVIQLAGRAEHFDLVADYGVAASYARALDRTTQLAFAAGIEALRDAGVPLVRTFKTTTTGKQVPLGWALPESWRAGTGIVFASAFPGYDYFARHQREDGKLDEGRFDRRFLFQILSMGHSQFAQFIGAQGPNTQVNAACASTTQAISVAEDWLRLGRAERVIVVGADDVTSDQLLEWIGAGFLAAGAATTEADVTKAALPFDRRRHGMIIGMGAVGLVLERGADAEARGVTPIAELICSRVANSAFHGTRLDVGHIAGEFRALIGTAAERLGTTPEAMASRTIFMSHETYTPARGGSAGAEIAALRAAFGEGADEVVVANTKGFTGHAMGAGIEDAVVLKALQHQTAPPIPNLKEPDPELGNLRLSPGGAFELDYAVRLAAGFGSQLALTVWKAIGKADDRVDAPRHAAWLREVTGWAGVETFVQDRALRMREAEVVEAPVVAVPAAAAAAVAAPAAPGSEVLDALLDVIGQHTGYGREDLELDYELEADLGIDTVKQAEIFAEVRDRFGVARDDGFQLADYPTIRALAAWLTEQTGGAPDVAALAPAPETPAAAAPSALSTPEASDDQVLEVLLGVIGEHTGYDREDLDLDYELEADLGIDTVKQAEIFAEVRDRFGVARDDGFQLADYPTIRALAGWLSSQTGAAVAPPAPVVDPAPAVVQAPEEEPAAAPTGEVLDTLLEVVGEHTGYDREDLDLDYELEADLGIDTVKQAEIFAEVRDRFGVARDDGFQLADYPTLRALSGWLEGQVHGAPATAAEASAPVASAPVQAEPEPEPEPVVDPRALPEAVHLRRPAEVDVPLLAPASLAGRTVRVLGVGPIPSAVKRVVTARGGRIFEGGDGDRPDAIIDAGTDVFECFQLARDPAERPRSFWLSLTMLVLPEADLEHASFEGARAGFTKALGREWEHVTSRRLDIEPGVPPDRAAGWICDELFLEGATEVFRGVDGARRAVELVDVALPVRDMPLEGEPVVLLTGGGRGITARVALELAERGPCTLVLVGRSPAGEDPLDEDSAKARIRKQLTASGERATPVAIERHLRPLRNAEEVRSNLVAMAAAGATVAYERCDLSDTVAVEALVEEVVGRYGRLDLCIHGAGVEESRLLEDKDDAAFHRVFDAKAVGGLVLAQALPSGARLISMGSVAGRFGNTGQADYAAANEAMAQVCRARGDALHICWTAWGDVGMASRGGMDSLLTRRGVDLLPADAGAACCVDLLLSGASGELVVAGSLGDMEPAPSHPLVDRQVVGRDRVVLTRTLDVAQDPWLLDHAIDGTVVVPGVIGVEWMTAAASRLLGTVRELVEVRFEKPAKLHRGEPLELEIEAVREGEGARCVVRSRRTAATGRTLETEHFHGVARSVAQAPEALPPACFPDEPLDRAAIYARFFHGPVFQVLSDVESVTGDGLLVQAGVLHAPLGHGLLTCPLALEAAFQAAGLHTMILDGVLALPAAFDRLVIERALRDGQPAIVTARRVGDTYDVDVDGPDGRVLALRGFEMIERGPLPDGDSFELPEAGWADAAFGVARVVEGASGALNRTELAELTARGTPQRQADRIAGRVAAKRAIASLTGASFERIHIARAPSGEPLVRLDGAPGPRVSITHSGGRAMAVASWRGKLGLDLEQVRARHPAFAEEWFSVTEQARFGNDPAKLTMAWAAKEAVLKALGLGMAGNPREIEVEALDDGRVHLVLHGALAIEHGARGGGRIAAWVRLDEGEVLVGVRLAA